jgi:hypothetical protein
MRDVDVTLSEMYTHLLYYTEQLRGLSNMAIREPYKTALRGMLEQAEMTMLMVGAIRLATEPITYFGGFYSGNPTLSSPSDYLLEQNRPPTRSELESMGTLEA